MPRVRLYVCNMQQQLFNELPILHTWRDLRRNCRHLHKYLPDEQVSVPGCSGLEHVRQLQCHVRKLPWDEHQLHFMLRSKRNTNLA